MHGPGGILSKQDVDIRKKMKPKGTKPILQTAKKWMKNIKNCKKAGTKARTHDLGILSALPCHWGGYTSVSLNEIKYT